MDNSCKCRRIGGNSVDSSGRTLGDCAVNVAYNDACIGRQDIDVCVQHFAPRLKCDGIPTVAQLHGRELLRCRDAKLLLAPAGCSHTDGISDQSIGRRCS